LKEAIMTYKKIPSGTRVIVKPDISPHRDFAGQVSDEYIYARRMGDKGKVIGDIYGTCGEVLIVKHPHCSAAYYKDELIIG
jgi:hypothetical protein